ncbi:MAG: efflux RND transporter periplasmic adaptor subunit [Clostridium sp.]|uniref:efflux RND transporter periplasmic adaptor subunit n=1 Tax=Clostridium sp. TaxID=1506 RepID=UPI003D6CF8A4
MHFNKKWLCKKKKFTRAFTLILITGVLSSTFTGCRLFPKEENVQKPVLVAPPKMNYTTVDVKKGSISNELKVTAVIISSSKHKLYFEKKGGVLKKLLVKPGDTVKKGQLLAVLDSDNLECEIKEQQLKLKKAKITLTQLTEEKKQKYEIAKATLDVQIEELTLENYKKELEKSKLLSPVSGIVDFCINDGVGALLSAYETIYSVSDPNSYVAEFEGENVSDYKIGMKGKILCNNNSYVGEVITVEHTLRKEDKSHKYPYVKVKFLEKANDISLGANVDFYTIQQKKDNILVLPRKVVYILGDQSCVQVLANGEKVEKFIEIGIGNKEQVQVVSGIKEGEKVIRDAR